MFSLNLQRLIESFKSLDPRLDSVAAFLAKDLKSNLMNPMLSVFDSLLPNLALVHGPPASGITTEKFAEVGSMEFLNLTVYLISNKFPAKSNRN